MTNLHKIAILKGADDGLTFEIDEIQRCFQRIGIATKVFYESDSITEFAPDCVLVTSAQDGKLTAFPTYGLINQPRDSYLEIPRLTRNLLSYDGYLTFSPRLAEMLRDITFGARKLNTDILQADFFPCATTYQEPRFDQKQKQIAIFDPDFGFSNFKNAAYEFLSKHADCRLVTFSINNVEKFRDRIIVVSSLDELDDVLQKFPIIICLNGGDQQEGTIHPAVIKIISTCAVTITHHTAQLEKYFGNNLYYLHSDLTVKGVCDAIKVHLDEIEKNQVQAIAKVKAAHQIFLEKFAFDRMAAEFKEMHLTVLQNKGYIPKTDAAHEPTLPSATYIVHANGSYPERLARLFACLKNQQYPDLRVIVAANKDIAFLDKLSQDHRALITKVIFHPDASDSALMREALQSVDTELFGLIDEDTELYANHVRQLVKTMHYHSGRDWRGEIGCVYSGSIRVNEKNPVPEPKEFQDHRLSNKNEKRAMNHFQYYSAKLMAQHAWSMPGGWLARTRLLDAEILADPAFDVCDDVYLLLLIAQKTHFAFSVEVTMARHVPASDGDIQNAEREKTLVQQRIALLNLSRTYAQDALYDTVYNIVGRPSRHDVNQVCFHDFIQPPFEREYWNQFYPFRMRPEEGDAGVQEIIFAEEGTSHNVLLKILLFPSKLIRFIRSFFTMDNDMRWQYTKKLMMSMKREGLLKTLFKLTRFIFRAPSSR